jgi:isoquinoline 1-oxidoreductase beta subunit
MWQALSDARTDEFRNSRLRDDGDVEAALNGATVIEAEYRAPFLAHAALEPLSATVLVEADRVHDLDRDAGPRRGARRGGRAHRRRSVAGHRARPAAGGSFGRRLDHDYVVQAIQIAATMPGTPIKTTWSREEDMTHDYPRPLHMAVGRGAVAERPGAGL